MITRLLHPLICLGLVVASLPMAHGQDASSLRLVPFPKQVQLLPGHFRLDKPLVIEAPRDVAPVVEGLIGRELRLAGLDPPQARATDNSQALVRILAAEDSATVSFTLREGASEEDYGLRIQPGAVTIGAPGTPGLLYGVATLRQLVRANRRENRIPCLQIDDWPSIRWRAFQDDITRGPSTLLSELKRDVARGALLKFNIFTYYMQHQFAFSKHPIIGPKDGSLTPGELAELVQYAEPLGVHVMGNQQSFAHMQHTLAHEQYAHLREDERTLSPVKDQTYQLLDDLYSDVMPILKFPLFNVCCDETWGLGAKGPSKTLAEKIGPGGVYIRHIQRVHDLVHGKYGKRMMMWGDIILNHPDKLEEIPKDVIMLTWGYGPRDSFEDQIIPFAHSGYQFFVCPGVNNWRRVLPDFRHAVANIRHFVRDGAKHGASGVLITSWDDDGENLNAPNWHGFAWAAECAWNASTTSMEDFNRRIGAVLFGEQNAHFGQAIELLSGPELSGMNNRTFWDDDLMPVRPGAAQPAGDQLQVIRQAIRHLEACRDDATVDGDLLDAVIFGARRLELYHERVLDRLEAAAAYQEAGDVGPDEAAARLQAAADAIRRTRDRYVALKDQWQELWLRENKPFALDWSLERYDRTIERYDQMVEKLLAIRGSAEKGRPLPPPADVGLAVWAKPQVLAVPARIESSLGNYQDYYAQFALDGNQVTFFWSDRGLQAGDHFTLTLDRPTAFRSIIVLMGTSRYRNEYVHDGALEISRDGYTWTKVADLSGGRTETQLPAEPIKSFRLTANQPQRYWLIIREIILQ